MFEAVHGSAPDIAGKNIANPSGLLNAAVQMLIHIGEVNSAKLIYDAWLKTLEDGIHTADLYKEKTSSRRVSTSEFAKAIVNNLNQKPHTLNELKVQNKTLIYNLQENYQTDYKVKKLVGSDITTTWNDFNQVICLFQSHNMSVESIYVKGLLVWPGNVNNTSDQITYRFIVNGENQHVNNSDINNILTILEENNFDVIKMEKLYIYDGVKGFFS